MSERVEVERGQTRTGAPQGDREASEEGRAAEKEVLDVEKTSAALDQAHVPGMEVTSNENVDGWIFGETNRF